MGIEGLNDVLKKCSPKSAVTCKASQLKDYRLAFEMGVLMNAHLSINFNKIINQSDIITYGIDEKQLFIYWARSILSFLSKFLRLGVIPVLVFDGPPRVEKLSTISERKNVKAPKREKARQMLEELRKKDILAVTPYEIKELRLAWQNCYSINSDLICQLKNICYCLGFPVLQAKYDAEQLCASLAIEGKVLGTYTTDTDTYTFGSPWVYTKMETVGDDIVLQARHLPTILSDLNMTQSNFVDMCILAGCDYNVKPGNYNVRAKTAYNDMKKYGQYQNMPAKYHIPELNMDGCRKIFSYVKSEEFSDDKIVVDVQLNNITQLTDAIMADYGMTDYKIMICNYIKAINPGIDVQPSDNLKYSAPRLLSPIILVFDDETPPSSSQNSPITLIFDCESDDNKIAASSS